jgi:hypothetical protein
MEETMTSNPMRMKAMRAYAPAPQERSIVRVLDLVLERLGQHIAEAGQARTDGRLAALHTARGEALKLASGLGQVCRNAVEEDAELKGALAALQGFSSQLCLKLMRAGKRDSAGAEWAEISTDIDALRARLQRSVQSK